MGVRLEDEIQRDRGAGTGVIRYGRCGGGAIMGGRGKLFPEVGYVLGHGGLYGDEMGARREAVHTIRFGSYNICNCDNGGLESALRGMPQANIDPGVFQETKFMEGIYMSESGGY